MEFVIKLEKNGIMLNPQVRIEPSKVNISFTALKFITDEKVYLRVRAEANEADEYELVLRVIEYFPKDIVLFNNSIALGKYQSVRFRDRIDSDLIKRDLKAYNDFLVQQLREEEIERKRREAYLFKNATSQQQQVGAESFFSKPEFESKAYNVTVTFEDANYHDGYVSVSVKLPGFAGVHEVQIFNSHILEQFGAISSWFSKKLGKKFRVEISVKLKEGEVVELTGKSEEISRINPDLIAKIRHERIIQLPTLLLENKEPRCVYSLQELLGSLTSVHQAGSNLNRTEQEIIDILITKRECRNKNELRYLAGTLQSLSYPINFTLTPYFGYVFYIEGKNHNHFVWELLDTNATYIWSFTDKTISFDKSFDRMQSVIAFVRELKREKYRQAYKNGKIDNDLKFQRLAHVLIDDQTTNFDIWKEKIEAILE
jgi:DNA-binding Lrp family transcriptional regulator